MPDRPERRHSIVQRLDLLVVEAAPEHPLDVRAGTSKRLKQADHRGGTWHMIPVKSVAHPRQYSTKQARAALLRCLRWPEGQRRASVP
ncbi:MAG: hypothetical protein ACRDRL_23295, partial [Sciscionella sp.]